MATLLEVGIELKRLRSVLPPPRGVSPDAALDGYATALAPFPQAIVIEAIDRYLAAEFPDISLKFYPRAPELAHLCRVIQARHGEEAARAARIAQQERERQELAEAEKVMVKTPEQKARAAQIMAEFHAGLVDSKAREAAEQRERDRMATRARYGMTPEVLASIPDRPLPKGMRQLGYLLPGAPVPAPALPPPDRANLHEDRMEDLP